MRKLKPIPKTVSEVLNNTIDPYIVGSKDNNSQNRLRGNDISLKEDKVKEFSVGLKDIDNAVLYYFNNNIKPNIIQNNQKVTVPVIYGSPERWKSIQNDGYYRDEHGKLMAPLIVFKRSNIEKNRNLGNKLDGNNPHLYQAFKEKYNQKNFYDKFSLVNNIKPSEKYYLSVIPDYITIIYECIIFTDYIEQNNKLIEAIEFVSDSYWGDSDRFNFRVNVDNFSTATTVEQGQDRAIKTTLNLKLQGYIIPDTINKQSVDKNRYFSKSQIIFNMEVSSTDLETSIFTGETKLGGSSNLTSFVGGGLNVNNNITNIQVSASSINASDLAYLNTSITATANIVTANTATFTGYSILEPTSGSSLPATSVNNFSFFANGNYIPQNAIVSFIGATNPILNIDPSILGYTLEYLLITAIGKFQ